MSYVINFTLQLFTFVGIELQVGLSYSLKNQLEVSKMFLICLPKYYDVVNKDTAYLQVVFSQAILHESLISSWCIGKTERHPVKLEETKGSYEKAVRSCLSPTLSTLL